MSRKDLFLIDHYVIGMPIHIEVYLMWLISYK